MKAPAEFDPRGASIPFVAIARILMDQGFQRLRYPLSRKRNPRDPSPLGEISGLSDRTELFEAFRPLLSFDAMLSLRMLHKVPDRDLLR